MAKSGGKKLSPFPPWPCRLIGRLPCWLVKDSRTYQLQKLPSLCRWNFTVASCNDQILHNTMLVKVCLFLTCVMYALCWWHVTTCAVLRECTKFKNSPLLLLVSPNMLLNMSIVMLDWILASNEVYSSTQHPVLSDSWLQEDASTAPGQTELLKQ